MSTFQELLETKAPTLGDRIRTMKVNAEKDWLRSLCKNGFDHSVSIESYLD